jgi:flagellar FliL protein
MMSDDFGDDVELEARPRQSGMSGKKIVLFILLPLLLLLGGAIAAVSTGVFGSVMEAASTTSIGGSAGGSGPAQGGGTPVYHDLPTMLVNLSTDGDETGYLKLTVSLELNSERSRERIEEVTPRIVDSFQVYLRELRIDDLEGSAGLQRLREELLLRVNNTVENVRVQDVLFKEMLVQ